MSQEPWWVTIAKAAVGGFLEGAGATIYVNRWADLRPSLAKQEIDELLENLHPDSYRTLQMAFQNAITNERDPERRDTLKELFMYLISRS